MKMPCRANGAIDVVNFFDVTSVSLRCRLTMNNNRLQLNFVLTKLTERNKIYIFPTVSKC